MKPPLYLDHSATTPLRPEAWEAMAPYLSEQFGNPSGAYRLARASKAALGAAREQVAAALGAAATSEVIFTGGGTESDNMAVLGLARAARARGRGQHVITSLVEHHAVLHPCEALERDGFRVTRLGVDGAGQVDPDELEAALTPQTALVSLMLANNEVGALQPVAQVAARLRPLGIPLHTDAVHAVGRIPVDVGALGVDALSLSAHKFRGPKGVGALWLRAGLPLEPLVYGGGQERGLRSGTENVAGAVGMARALSLAVEELPTAAPRQRALRDQLIAGILTRLDGVELTGHPEQRLPGHASFAFDGAEGESILLMLDREGVAASTGSACSTATLEPSHVLRAMGVAPSRIHGSLRLSLGWDHTPEEMDRAAAAVVGAVLRLREIAPRAGVGAG